MGYIFKYARNGKSVSKIPKWQSLKPLALKSKIIRRFGFSENLEDIDGFFPCKSSSFFINSNRHKISSFNARGLKRGHFSIFDKRFPFLSFVKL